jgi:hypothetical protein
MKKLIFLFMISLTTPHAFHAADNPAFGRRYGTEGYINTLGTLCRSYQKPRHRVAVYKVNKCTRQEERKKRKNHYGVPTLPRSTARKLTPAQGA